MAIFERRACTKGCGKMVDPRGAHKHEAACGGSTTDSRQPAGSAPKGAPPRRAGSKRKAGRKTRAAPASRHLVAASSQPCLFCGGGPNDVLVRDLAVRMIRGGMNFEIARDMVRDVLALVGR